MNQRQFKQRTIAMMLTSPARFWRSIPSALSFPDVAPVSLVAIFREAAGISTDATTLHPDAVCIDGPVDSLLDTPATRLMTQLLADLPNRGTAFDPPPQLFDVRRKKDGVVLFTGLPFDEALEHVATAKRQKKAALEVVNEFSDL